MLPCTFRKSCVDIRCACHFRVFFCRNEVMQCLCIFRSSGSKDQAACRYMGKGVQKAVENINKIISPGIAVSPYHSLHANCLSASALSRPECTASSHGIPAITPASGLGGTCLMAAEAQAEKSLHAHESCAEDASWIIALQ